MKNNAIAIVINAAFVKYAKTLIKSIQSNWPNHPQILLFLSETIGQEDRLYFESTPKLKTVNFNPNDYEYRKALITTGTGFSTTGFNDAGYFIVNFWSPAFEQYDNILVLDADMLVLKNLDELVSQENFFAVSAANPRRFPIFDIKKKGIGKIFEFATIYLRALCRGIVVKPGKSINSGVLVIPKKWRTQKKYEEILQLLKNFYSHCPSDQEIIYLWMLKNRIAERQDFRMNFQARFINALASNILPRKFSKQVQAASADIHILHFNGPKPDSARFKTHPWTTGRDDLVDLYLQYASKP